MALRNRVRAAGAHLFALALGALLVSAPTMAQSPAAPAPGADLAKAQEARQTSQPLNNQPVWSEIRSGVPQTTSIPGRETNVLIQPQGQTWRASRVPIAMAGGLLVALALAGLALFYMVRGRMDVATKPGDRVIQRFASADRYAHWLLAITWVTLALTGLVLSFGKAVLLPLIGPTLFSWLATLAKNLHNFVGPILVIAVPWMVIRFLRDNGIGVEDLRWFANLIGYFRGHEYPSRKFNAGEKIVFWVIVVILSSALVVTGFVLAFPNFDQTRATMQTANLVHMIVAYIAISLALVHVYLGTIGVGGAYRAMRDGVVDASWAEHHHQRWYQDVAAGKAREQFVDPARGTEAPAAVVRPRTA